MILVSKSERSCAILTVRLCMTASAKNRRRCFRLYNNPHPSSSVRHRRVSSAAEAAKRGPGVSPGARLASPTGRQGIVRYTALTTADPPFHRKKFCVMPYAIMRFDKRKGGPTSAIEKHHERKEERYASNTEVDTDRSHLNYHLIQPQHKYYAEIPFRIEHAQRENSKCKVRKDSVKFIDTIFTATPEYLAHLPPEKVRRYFERALDFFKTEVGEANIFSAVVHMDEHNPHMHLCFVPLTKGNRLLAKEVLGVAGQVP